MSRRAAAQETAKSLLREAMELGLQPKESKASQTGYENVIEIKDKFQGQLWDKARRKQRAVPGLHDTAVEAALALARAKQIMAQTLEHGETLPSPAKRKSRHRQQSAVPFAMAEPTNAMSPRLPFAVVQPISVGLLTPMTTLAANVPNGASQAS
jgi:hypothetical protein